MAYVHSRAFLPVQSGCASAGMLDWVPEVPQMRIPLFCLFLVGSGLLSGQRPQFTMSIRSISVRPVSTSQKGLAQIDFDTIKAPWRSSQVNPALAQQPARGTI